VAEPAPAPASLACREGYRPGDPDPLRDGLLKGWRDHAHVRERAA
jgi:hypothetical protein